MSDNWRPIHTLTWHQMDRDEYETDRVILGWEETAEQEGDVIYGRGVSYWSQITKRVVTEYRPVGSHLPMLLDPPTHWQPLPAPPKRA